MLLAMENASLFDRNLFTHLAEHASENDETRARLSAALVYKGRVIAIGRNKRKSHPFQAKFGRNEDSIYLHAETDCIHKALKQISVDDMRKATLYVCRVKNSGAGKKKQQVLGMAKPCLGCYRAILQFGIKKVVYTTDENTIETLQ